MEISRGSNAQQRLMEMGIVPGVENELLARHPFRGPVIIQLNNTRIALGRRLASTIEVDSAPDK
jgi:ferrous iron transport protein A